MGLSMKELATAVPEGKERLVGLRVRPIGVKADEYPSLPILGHRESLSRYVQLERAAHRAEMVAVTAIGPPMTGHARIVMSLRRSRTYVVKRARRLRSELVVDSPPRLFRVVILPC